MKARFVCEQQPVRIVSTEKHDYIFICVNGVEGDENYTDKVKSVHNTIMNMIMQN